MSRNKRISVDTQSKENANQVENHQTVGGSRTPMTELLSSRTPMADITTFYVEKSPSKSKKNYADILGIEPTKWEEGLTAIDISRMIEAQRIWADDFHTANVDPCATGLQKEALRFRHICFDETTLTRQQALKLFIRNSGGIRLDQLKVLRHELHVPLADVIDLRKDQAHTLIQQLKEARLKGLLTDVPAEDEGSTSKKRERDDEI
ncbi:hypothetical protein R1sor_022490 [Riccia sorocarpa]|uniref:Uncharacterized protein n=1 Tax=Riccia sorocarpa TaxID=122646 RepID=A0ABD3GQW1_9MARC